MKRKFIKKTKNVCSFKEYVANAKGFCMQAACEDSTKIAGAKYTKAMQCYKKALFLKPSKIWINNEIQAIKEELRLIDNAESFDKVESFTAIYVNLEVASAVQKPCAKRLKHSAKERIKAVKKPALDDSSNVLVVEKTEQAMLKVRAKIPKKAPLELHLGGIGDKILSKDELDFHEVVVTPSLLQAQSTTSYQWIEFLEGLKPGEYIRMIGDGEILETVYE
ncbi:MAG: hypothetical protein AB8B68_05390 [Rickettsiaceae bacterium]